MACMNKRRQFLILVVLLCTLGFNIPGLAEETDSTLMESGVSEFSNPIQNSIFSLLKKKDTNSICHREKHQEKQKETNPSYLSCGFIFFFHH